MMLAFREEETTRLTEAVAAYRAALEFFDSNRDTYFIDRATSRLAEVEALIEQKRRKTRSTGRRRVTS